MDKNNYSILLCGGTGNRLWPYSRTAKPKQFLDLLGLGQTLIQITYQRIKRIVPAENIYISTQKEYVPFIQEQLPELPVSHIICEPVSLGTAPAVALASAYIYAQNKDANILVTPVDQLILNDENYRKELTACLEFVKNNNKFVAIGVKPTRPEVSYGYIQASSNIIDGVCKVKSFTEKPNDQFAQLFCESGEFLWSTGLFLFQAKTYLNFYGESHPTLLELVKMIDAGTTTEELHSFVDEQYPRTLFQSLDLLILEHCSNVYVKECTFGWSDLGNWDNLYNVSQKDMQGNVVLNSQTELYNCQNNIIKVQDKILLMKGLENYIVVESDNVLVICPKEDSALLRRMQTNAQMRFGDKIK